MQIHFRLNENPTEHIPGLNTYKYMNEPQISQITANEMFTFQEFLVKEQAPTYYTSNPDYPFQQEAYKIIGACMEVHSVLGKGFLEIIYKDALEYEFKLRGIPYEREKRFDVKYKGITLNRHFYVDFFVYNEIVLEAKAQQGIVDELYKQTINYLAASEKSLGLLVNFGEDSLKYKRVILSKKTMKI